MKILKQLAIILGVCLAGEAIQALLPFPFPSSVAAMVLLLILLLTRLVHPEQIEGTADFLLQNMSFFFLPAAVGILRVFDAIKPHLTALLIITLLTTLITFAVSGFTVTAVLHLQKKKDGDRA